ncbi:hypothetical protein HY750_00295 [Candidatus Kuenenbacteria bacterium]|nr:hypothetical protein [Candidatus Kuenenbacteria bacterium]
MLKIKTSSKILFSLFLIVFCASLVIPMVINIQSVNAAVNAEDLLPGNIVNQSGLPKTELKATIMRIINIVLGFLGIIAIIIIIIGGFKWMTCGGSEEKTTEAREMIIAGIIGLVIILAAYAIANFIISQYLGAMNNTT